MDEYARSFKWVATLPCDVPLGDHAEQFNFEEKAAKRVKDPNGPNPYIDPRNCKTEAHLQEVMLHAVIDELRTTAINPNFRPIAPEAGGER